jgi:molybdopterin/thiamine biosynthesis adenylyltransferase
VLRVLAALREGVHVAAGASVGTALDPDVAAVADALADRLASVSALVRRAPQDDVLGLSGEDLYDRQIRFLSYYETFDTSGLALNDRLQDSTVLLTGLGGLGGWIALMLARLGIRRIIGVEPDGIELSNLHRQVLYGRDDIGRRKVDAAVPALLAADPTIDFRGEATWIHEPADLLPLLEGVDLAINAFPYIPSFAKGARATAEATVQAGVPTLSIPMTHGIGPLTLPGETPCIECVWPVLQPKYHIDARNAATEPSWAGKGFLAALAPRQAITAGIAVWEVVRYLSGMERPRTLDGVAFVDIAGFAHHDFVEVPRNPECGLCGGAVLRRRARRTATEAA